MTHFFALSAAATDIMSISLRSRLSAARLTYIDSLHGASRQQSFTASLLLDEAVRRCFPSVPRPLDIAANENGKPYLTAAPNVHFSLSHSAAWAVCAVSDHPVGVDIQQCRSFNPNIADRFFHPDEVQYLSSLSPAERENAFYTLWALKESYVKADGRGLRLLRQFCVDIACQTPAITVGAPCSLFVPDFPDPTYRLGVCVRETGAEAPKLTVLRNISAE